MIYLLSSQNKNSLTFSFGTSSFSFVGITGGDHATGEDDGQPTGSETVHGPHGGVKGHLYRGSFTTAAKSHFDKNGVNAS